ncbi:MAG: carbohydrate kinase [Kiritimatiellia bacterium]
MSLSKRKQLALTLSSRRAELSALPVLTGFDGFVDEMITVVNTREDLRSYTKMDTISAFGKAVSAAAGHSSLREIVIRETHPGGCAVNMGDGLSRLGVPVCTYATVGNPLHAAFAEYAEQASLYSWGDEPGRTLAFEFDDGKLMFSAVEQLQSFHPDALRGYLESTPFEADCAAAKVIALTDWTLYPHMTACWDLLREQVFAKLENPVFFFDLVDPSSRSEADIRDMLPALTRFQSLGEVNLGLNQNEANILSRYLGLPITQAKDPEAALDQAAALCKALKISRVILHAIPYAVSAGDEGMARLLGPYCEHPVKSTGAGDRFNAGWVLGRVLQLDETEKLMTACACSGAFVRKGLSGNLEGLCDLLESPWPGDSPAVISGGTPGA